MTPPRRLGVWVLVPLLCGAAMLLIGPAEAGSHRVVTQPGQVLAAPAHPLAEPAGTRDDGRAPLLELFTATWCPPCAPADRAVDRLLSEAANASQEGVAVSLLAYHPWPDPGIEDPFGVPDGMARMQRKHGATWFPSAYVGGVLEDEPATRSVTVDAAMEQVLYDGYRSLLRRAADIGPVFVTEMAHTESGGNVTLEVTLTAHADVDGRLFVQPVLWEDPVFFPGSNGIDEHRMVVRSLLARHLIDGGVEAGDVWSQTWRFVVPAEVDASRAGVTLVVEAAWGPSSDDTAQRLMTYAAFAAVGAIMVVAVSGRRKPPAAGGP